MMRLIGAINTAVLSLILVVPVCAQQEQHDQDQEKARPAQDEKRAQPEKSAKPDEKGAQQEKNAKPEERNVQQEKNVKPEERNARQENNTKPEERNTQQQHAQPVQRAAANRADRIPDDRYRANFGQEHRFRVNQADYNNRRFQYGGYSFGFVDAWPSNWLYTQDVFVVEIDGVYYLCNASYPGVNIQLSFTQ